METHHSPRYPVDLQTHTTCSDGTESPGKLVAHAARLGIRVLAITDHDTLLGLREAQEAAHRHGVRLLPGIEFSTRHEPERDLLDINILGYGIDPDHPDLQEVLRQVMESRLAQKIRQIERLQSYGLRVPVDEVLALAQGVPGRPHIAQVALRHNPERFSSIEDVFRQFLASDAPHSTYVPRDFSLRVEEVIQIVHGAGGIAVLAHPGLYHRVRDVDAAIRRMVDAGLDGIEVRYPYYREGRRAVHGTRDREVIGHFAEVARRHDLLVTGGSDYHGARKPNQLGEAGLTWEEWEELAGRAGWAATPPAPEGPGTGSGSPRRS